jgi:ADP-ribosylglycohydrolase
MPTQLLSADAVLARWGAPVAGFAPADDDHPVAAGLPAGRVTDDTEQAVLVGRLLRDGQGRIAPAAVADALVAWEREMAARGSLDLLGPSTRRAVQAIRDGTPVEEAGRRGDTNGAAMRIAPVGVATPDDDLAALVERVREASRATHDTSVGLAGAGAVAAAVSAGVAGRDVDEATGRAIAAAERAARLGRRVAGADVATRIAWAVALVSEAGEREAREAIVRLVGTSVATAESVPAAFAVLAVCPADPWRACRLAASLGGDSDTIAAMAGAIGGAVHGIGAFPGEAVATIRSVNPGLGLEALARDLLAVRGRA